MRNRLLGFAFAASDLLIEVTPTGNVTFALGVGPSADLPADGFMGQSLLDRLEDGDAETLRPILANLLPGARSEPLKVVIAAGDGLARRAGLRLFMLPELAPNISCSMNWDGPVYPLTQTTPCAALTPDGFLERSREVLTASNAPAEIALAFVDVLGLAAANDMGSAGARLNARVEAALQAVSLDGVSAGRLGPERFSMLECPAGHADLEHDVHRIGRSEGLDLSLQSSRVPLDTTDNPLNALRALRFAVEHCLRDGGLERPDLSFSNALASTLKSADRFKAMVRDRDFALHYQPIVDLKTGAVHHFEALARFNGTTGPADTIRMAEELALVGGFDLTVAEMALGRLRRPGAGLLKFAINVSGASLADDRYVQSLLRMTSLNPQERQRLIVEVTESATLVDIEAANRRLNALRAAGIKVCIDDFGAGSAAYDYLRGLSVDTVKIDGRFVEGLESDPRARTLISHMVELCRSLEVNAIVERIETQAVADILRDLGVGYGQGWLFGKAEAEPRTQWQPVEPARRLGAVVGWG